VRRIVAALCLSLVSAASALDIPTDASVLVTSRDGTIVGVGRVEAGSGFVLELLPGYVGAATLLFTTPGGEVHVLDVEVREGTVFVADTDLRAAAAAAGAEEGASTGEGEAAGATTVNPGGLSARD